MLLAADAGKRDVLRVGEAEFTSDTEFSVALEVIHDEELAAMDITTNGDGGPSRKAGEQSTSSAPLSDKEVDYWLRMFDRKK